MKLLAVCSNEATNIFYTGMVMIFDSTYFNTKTALRAPYFWRRLNSFIVDKILQVENTSIIPDKNTWHLRSCKYLAKDNVGNVAADVCDETKITLSCYEYESSKL